MRGPIFRLAGSFAPKNFDEILKTVMRIFILEPPPLKNFLIASTILHLMVMLIHGLVPVTKSEATVKPPIKIRYVPPEPEESPKKTSTLIDAPQPRKIETPDRSELISSYDSRAHSNRKKTQAKKYKSSKTVVPKTRGTPSLTKKALIPPRKKHTTQKPITRKEYPVVEKGFIIPKPEKPIENPNRKTPSGGALALLDGFDADKFASMSTQESENAGDGEVISLDTRESKYASYFARIKHQIERVWTYPEGAARRGISGQLTLRFRISKEGNLLDVRLMDVSGSDVLDLAAVQAVKGAAPYYPFPVTIDKESLSILATFIYSPTYSSEFQNNR